MRGFISLSSDIDRNTSLCLASFFKQDSKKALPMGLFCMPVIHIVICRILASVVITVIISTLLNK